LFFVLFFFFGASASSPLIVEMEGEEREGEGILRDFRTNGEAVESTNQMGEPATFQDDEGQNFQSSFPSHGIYGFSSPAFPTFFSSPPSSSKKSRLPPLHLTGRPLMASPVETSPVTSYVFLEQPIKSPHTVIQPVIHQRLVEQPITKTRLITQPVIRRLITQPILQPHVIQTTRVQQQIYDQPITVPRVTKQDIVRQVLVEQRQSNKPLSRPPVVEHRAPRLTTSFMGKESARPLTTLEAQMAAHPELKFNLEDENKFNWM